MATAAAGAGAMPTGGHFAGDSSVMVAVRVRPMNKREKDLKSMAIVNVVPPTGLHLLDNPGTAQDDEKDFAYDEVFGEDSTQDGFYDRTAKHVLDQTVAGYNACVFAYGQTGSGKTFTMQGAENSTDPALQGVIPRLCADLFARLDDLRSKGQEGVVEATYVEIYREKLTDLWDADGDGRPDSLGAATAAAAAGAASTSTPKPAETGSTPKPAAGAGKPGDKPAAKPAAAPAPAPAAAAAATGPRIRQTPAGEIILDGVTRRVIKSFDLLNKLLAEGQKRRTVGETSMNAVSSRSHAVLTLHLVISDTDLADGNDSRKAKLHLVDLAGSERADATGATGDRLKEGASINQSLSALGNVINALTTAGPKTYVPYRDSSLTRLLQDSLGGNAFTLCIVCISPAAVNYNETLATLRFATRAKAIKTKVTKNVDPAVARINALQAENKGLRDRVVALYQLLAGKVGKEAAAAAVAKLAATIPGLPADLSAMLGSVDLSRAPAADAKADAGAASTAAAGASGAAATATAAPAADATAAADAAAAAKAKGDADAAAAAKAKSDADAAAAAKAKSDADAAAAAKAKSDADAAEAAKAKSDADAAAAAKAKSDADAAAAAKAKSDADAAAAAKAKSDADAAAAAKAKTDADAAAAAKAKSDADAAAAAAAAKVKADADAAAAAKAKADADAAAAAAAKAKADADAAVAAAAAKVKSDSDAASAAKARADADAAAAAKAKADADAAAAAAAKAKADVDAAAAAKAKADADAAAAAAAAATKAAAPVVSPAASSALPAVQYGALVLQLRAEGLPHEDSSLFGRKKAAADAFVRLRWAATSASVEALQPLAAGNPAAAAALAVAKGAVSASKTIPAAYTSPVVANTSAPAWPEVTVDLAALCGGVLGDYVAVEVLDKDTVTADDVICCLTTTVTDLLAAAAAKKPLPLVLPSLKPGQSASRGTLHVVSARVITAEETAARQAEEQARAAAESERLSHRTPVFGRVAFTFRAERLPATDGPGALGKPDAFLRLTWRPTKESAAALQAFVAQATKDARAPPSVLADDARLAAASSAAAAALVSLSSGQALEPAFNSEVVKENCDPTWARATLDMKSLGCFTDETLCLEAFDFDAVTGNDIIGSVNVTVDALLKAVASKQGFPLQAAAGKAAGAGAGRPLGTVYVSEAVFESAADLAARSTVKHTMGFLEVTMRGEGFPCEDSVLLGLGKAKPDPYARWRHAPTDASLAALEPLAYVSVSAAAAYKTVRDALSGRRTVPAAFTHPVINNTVTPAWPKALIPLGPLCGGLVAEVIAIEVLDKDAATSDDIIGVVTTSVEAVLAAAAAKKPLPLVLPFPKPGQSTSRGCVRFDSARVITSEELDAADRAAVEAQMREAQEAADRRRREEEDTQRRRREEEERQRADAERLSARVPVFGDLYLTVRAEGLPASDSVGLFRRSGGKPDAYVRARWLPTAFSVAALEAYTSGKLAAGIPKPTPLALAAANGALAVARAATAAKHPAAPKPAWSSGVVKDNCDPVWGEAKLDLGALCGGFWDDACELSVVDKDLITSDDPIGTVTVTVKQLLEAAASKAGLPLVAPSGKSKTAAAGKCGVVYVSAARADTQADQAARADSAAEAARKAAEDAAAERRRQDEAARKAAEDAAAERRRQDEAARKAAEDAAAEQQRRADEAAAERRRQEEAAAKAAADEAARVQREQERLSARAPVFGDLHVTFRAEGLATTDGKKGKADGYLVVKWVPTSFSVAALKAFVAASGTANPKPSATSVAAAGVALNTATAATTPGGKPCPYAWKSTVVANNAAPSWLPALISLTFLNGGLWTDVVELRCYDKGLVKDDCIGVAYTTLEGILAAGASKTGLPLCAPDAKPPAPIAPAGGAAAGAGAAAASSKLGVIYVTAASVDSVDQQAQRAAAEAEARRKAEEDAAAERRRQEEEAARIAAEEAARIKAENDRLAGRTPVFGDLYIRFRAEGLPPADTGLIGGKRKAACDGYVGARWLPTAHSVAALTGFLGRTDPKPAAPALTAATAALSAAKAATAVVSAPCKPAYTSEVVNDSANPSWREAKIDLGALCGGFDDDSFQLSVSDKDLLRDDPVGSVTVTLKQLLAAAVSKAGLPLGPPAGTKVAAGAARKVYGTLFLDAARIDSQADQAARAQTAADAERQRQESEARAAAEEAARVKAEEERLSHRTPVFGDVYLRINAVGLPANDGAASKKGKAPDAYVRLAWRPTAYSIAALQAYIAAADTATPKPSAASLAAARAALDAAKVVGSNKPPGLAPDAWKSETVNNTCDPAWREARIDARGVGGLFSDRIQLAVWDADTFTRDDEIGILHTTIDQLLAAAASKQGLPLAAPGTAPPAAIPAAGAAAAGAGAAAAGAGGAAAPSKYGTIYVQACRVDSAAEQEAREAARQAEEQRQRDEAARIAREREDEARRRREEAEEQRRIAAEEARRKKEADDKRKATRLCVQGTLHLQLRCSGLRKSDHSVTGSAAAPDPFIRIRWVPTKFFTVSALENYLARPRKGPVRVIADPSPAAVAAATAALTVARGSTVKPAWTSPVAKSTTDPTFPATVLALQEVCGGFLDDIVSLEMLDKGLVADSVLGVHTTTVQALLEAADTQRELALVKPSAGEDANTSIGDVYVVSARLELTAESEIAQAAVAAAPPEPEDRVAALVSEAAGAGAGGMPRSKSGRVLLAPIAGAGAGADAKPVPGSSRTAAADPAATGGSGAASSPATDPTAPSSSARGSKPSSSAKVAPAPEPGQTGPAPSNKSQCCTIM